MRDTTSHVVIQNDGQQTYTMPDDLPRDRPAMTTLSISLIWLAGTAPTTLAASIALFARSAQRRAEARLVLRLLRSRSERGSSDSGGKQ
jgi:hypothetical protein